MSTSHAIVRAKKTAQKTLVRVQKWGRVRRYGVRQDVLVGGGIAAVLVGALVYRGLSKPEKRGGIVVAPGATLRNSGGSNGVPAQPRNLSVAIAAAIAAKNLRIQMEAQAAYLQTLSTKPAFTDGPGAVADWLNQTGLEPVTSYPELQWVVTNDPAHPETAYRAGYTVQGGPSDGDWVHWWQQYDGSWGWAEGSGGIDLGRTAGQLVNDAESVIGTFQSTLHGVLNNPVVNAIPWQLVADGLEAVTSNVPVLGTAVSDIVATAEVALTVLQTPLDQLLGAAVKAAYDYAMASTPDAALLRPALDPVVDLIINVAIEGQPLTTALINTTAEQAPAGLPRQIAASLLAFVASKLGIK